MAVLGRRWLREAASRQANVAKPLRVGGVRERLLQLSSEALLLEGSPLLAGEATRGALQGRRALLGAAVLEGSHTRGGALARFL